MILVPLLKLNQMYSFDYRNSSMQPDDWYIYIDCMHNDWEEVSVQKITIVNSNMNIACVCFMQYKFHRIVCFFKTLHSAHQVHPMNVAMHKHAYPQHEAQTLALGSLFRIAFDVLINWKLYWYHIDRSVQYTKVTFTPTPFWIAGLMHWTDTDTDTITLIQVNIHLIDLPRF